MTDLRHHRTVLLALGLGLLLPTAADAAEPTREQIDFFEKKIRPVLVEHCYKCHSEQSNKIKGGLRLDTRDALRTGGDSGSALVPGDPSKSLLLQAVRYTELQMPPSGKLPDNVAADFEKWIRDGAADPRNGTAAVQAPATKIDVEAGKRFWSFQPPRRHSAPEIARAAWPLKPIDRFILAGLELGSLEPAPAADRRTWL